MPQVASKRNPLRVTTSAELEGQEEPGIQEERKKVLSARRLFTSELFQQCHKWLAENPNGDNLF